MVYKGFLGRFVPDRCPGCGLATPRGFCTGCVSDLARVTRPCAMCGLERPVLVCPRRAWRWSVDRVVAPFRYVEPLQAYVQSLKFAGQRRLGVALGELLALELRGRAYEHGVDALVAVPLHRSRFLERGYNQAIEIARPVAAAIDRPLLVAGIARRRATPAQSLLSASARRANVCGAFSVSRDLKGACIAIVDDVFTTGATLDALAHALKAAGAATVHAWTIARSL